MQSLNKNALVAPCGMNCGVCSAYLREKNKCPGCRGSDAGKPVTRLECKIKNCQFFKTGKAKFCFACEIFPCATLKHLDDRYRAKYHMSMVENLKNIKSAGIRKFLKNEAVRWACQKCGGTICAQKGACHACGSR